MLQKGMTKVEIERELYGRGDFVLIDNITRFLKQSSGVPLDTKKFLYIKLIEIYERRSMCSEAGRLCEVLAELSITSQEKINHLLRATENYIKTGFFDKVDYTMKKALAESTISGKAQIYISVKSFYKNQAETYEKEKRRNNALKTYEKMLRMDIFESDRLDIEKKLLPLYKDLGMIKEFMDLNKRIGG